MSPGDSSTESLIRHCVRITNYSNLYDSVLKLSNAKRLGYLAYRSHIDFRKPTTTDFFVAVEYVTPKNRFFSSVWAST